jgi:uncharacterized protein (DUF2236 family)
MIQGLWKKPRAIHVTGWHSVLKCYERYGPGPLSSAEEARFWAESQIAAELRTCKSTDVPGSRDEVRQYFADVRDRLCTSEHADRAMRYLLWTPRSKGLRLWGGSRLMAPAAIATLMALVGWVCRRCGWEVYAQHLAAGTPAAPRTVTPAEARETLACS